MKIRKNAKPLGELSLSNQDFTSRLEDGVAMLLYFEEKLEYKNGSNNTEESQPFSNDHTVKTDSISTDKKVSKIFQ